MGDGKAQVALEFMICVFVLITVMTFFTIYSGSKDREGQAMNSKLQAERICWQISSIINTAMYSKGYYAEFSLPLRIDGYDYTVSITNGSVAVDYRGASCIYEIVMTNISLRSQQAPFSLCGGDYYISNTNNALFIYNRSPVGC
ncbi:MAG: hypothetical protein NTY73_04280 [Candidatus Micrarchaeota archaeon]|nr:hypothetical protein [Candidatus Micrarchaeota archaeon]